MPLPAPLPRYELEDQLTTPKKATSAKKVVNRKHWSEDFLKHLDAWGEELRKSKKKGKHSVNRCGVWCLLAQDGAEVVA